MPVVYLRQLTGKKRSEAANRRLAQYLAFIAGATDVGGYFAVRHYTSHMSGVVSSLALNFAQGSDWLVLIGIVSVLAFFLGSFLTTLFVRWARARELHSVFAMPLVAEAVLLLLFAYCCGKNFSGNRAVLDTVVLLCLAMGLQNALITKLSDAVIRTTHLTGMVTDIGIAMGRIVSIGWKNADPAIESELDSLRLLSSLIALFFAGGVTGAIGFRHVGFLFAIPLAVILLLLAGIPVVDDIRGHESATA